MSKLTHLDDAGRVSMVDVSTKQASVRTAKARGQVMMQAETLKLIEEGQLKKGDLLVTAQLAGIMGAKRTAELIPLCHPLPLTHIDVVCTPDAAASAVLVEASVSTTAGTGVEMEALTAVSIACLTIYDMAKAADRSMRIENIRLVEKRGGKSGDYLAE